MVSKCANPDCDKQLHYLREGRVYLFETIAAVAKGSKPAVSKNEHFWLCGDCARVMYLQSDGNNGVRIMRRPLHVRQSATSAYPHSLPA